MNGRIVLENMVEVSRREFVSRALSVGGWGAFGAALATGGVQTVRFFFPRVLFKPPSTFRVGTPGDFLARDGEADRYGVVFVDPRWKSAHRFFIVREKDRVYALSARCVHLGCTINWFPDLRIFKCPCHGSEYRSNGRNFAGPAPRPLDRLRIVLDVTGELVIDTGIVYGPQRFGADDAFVRL